MRLFSYCIPIDDGAAPNPYFGECTLVICKPVIRRAAKPGDWVCGVGSVNVDGKDYSGKLVYAMQVTSKMTLAEYDDHCRAIGSKKIPDLTSNDYRRKVGDCIYDFSDSHKVTLRPSVHTEANMKSDCDGEFALISKHFFYFGQNPVDLPANLKGIIRQGRGHQSVRNEHAKEDFVKWIEENYELNRLYGEPQIIIDFESKTNSKNCATIRCKNSEEDEALSYEEEKLPLSHWNISWRWRLT